MSRFRGRRSARWILLPLDFLFVLGAYAADPWPGPLPGTEIGQGLPAAYEPSGGAWHRRLNKFFTVSDSGIVSAMNPDGSGIVNWSVPGDLEGVAVADPASNFIYIGVEHPDSIREFNIVTGLVTRTFVLTAWMQGPDNSGLEALEFIPDPNHPEGGLFYAGLQNDGRIYEFSLPIRSSATATSVTFMGTITPVTGRTDISGLDYDREHQILYAVFDDANDLRAMRSDGTFVGEWVLPGNDQEGIAIRECELFVAEDSGKVWRYAFPTDMRDVDTDGSTNCFDPDDDNDGVPDGVDCAPLDVTASHLPSDVAGLTVTGSEPTILSWSGQGTGFRYDVASDGIASLKIAGGTGGAQCLLNDRVVSNGVDARPRPAAGTGDYYIVRAQNACGSGAYGSTSSGVPEVPAAACP